MEVPMTPPPKIKTRMPRSTSRPGWPGRAWQGRGRSASPVTASLDGSLRRLQRDHVDIFHLHNAITRDGGGDSLSTRQVPQEIVPAFEALRAAGKIRLLGITAIGETAALQQVIDTGVFGSAQVVYNMLNPSAGSTLPSGYPAQDYGRLFENTRRARVGVVGIRVSETRQSPVL